MYPEQSQAWRPTSRSYSAPPGTTAPPVQVTVNNWIAPPAAPQPVYRKRHPWLIAFLVILALAFWEYTLTVLVVAVLLRLAWHGYRAVRAQNAARRAHEDELRVRADAENQLWLDGDSRGFYGLGFHQ